MVNHLLIQIGGTAPGIDELQHRAQWLAIGHVAADELAEL